MKKEKPLVDYSRQWEDFEGIYDPTKYDNPVKKIDWPSLFYVIAPWVGVVLPIIFFVGVCVYFHVNVRPVWPWL